MGWFYLFIAIVFEVVGTTQLKRTDGNFFTSAGMLMLLFYAISFFMLTLALKNGIEVGVGYAIWSGVGTALIAIIGVMAFNEHASMMKFLCIAMIIIGVVGLKLNTKPINVDRPGTNSITTNAVKNDDVDNKVNIEGNIKGAGSVPDAVESESTEAAVLELAGMKSIS